MTTRVRSSRCRRAVILLSALALPCWPRPAPGAEHDLPEVVAVGEAPEAATEAQSKDPSGFVTVVEAAPGEAASAAELASASPGVVVRELGANQPASVSVRGSNSDQVVVLLDGLPLNPAGGGGVDLGALPAPFVERLSVARGAVGARYGAGALGGAIAIETRKPEPGERRLFGQLGTGSFSSHEGFLGSSFGLGEDGSALLAAYARTSEGDFSYLHDDKPQLDGNPLVERRRANNAARRVGGLGRLVLEAPFDVDLLLEADAGDRGVPGTVLNPTPAAEMRDARGLAIARLSAMAGATALELHAGTRLAWLQFSEDRARREAPQRERHYFSEFAAQRLLGRHALEAALKAGYEALEGPFHGEHGRLLASLFAGDEATFGPLALLPALRAEWVGAHFGLSPKLGTTLELGERLELKANAGRSFRAPSFGELYLEKGLSDPNPDLRPETASFADLGACARLAALRASLSGFYTLYDNLILYELYAPMRAKPYNFGKAEVYGGELELTASLGPASLAAAYTLAFSSNRTGDARYFGKDLPYHPRHRLHGRAELNLRRASAHLDLDLQSAQSTNRTSTYHLPGRARTDLGASLLVHPGAGLWLSAELENLFDQPGLDLYGYPQPGRAFYLSARLEADFTAPRSNR